MKWNQNLMTVVAGVAVMLGMVAWANGDVITNETIESSSVPAEATHPYTNMIDGSGLYMSGEVLVHNATHGDAWFSVVPYTYSFPFTVTIDLEGNYDLSSMDVWNYNSDNQYTRGISNVTISVASAEVGAFTSLGDFTFDLASNHGAGYLKYSAETFSLSASNVRLVQFEITSNHGDQYRTGMAEVQFHGALAQPKGTVVSIK